MTIRFMTLPEKGAISARKVGEAKPGSFKGQVLLYKYESTISYSDGNRLQRSEPRLICYCSEQGSDAAISSEPGYL